ncbi:MAG: PEP-CTERM sorting domain-containing protein [Kiritimatiellales bacterium]
MRKKWMSVVGIIVLCSGIIHADLYLTLTGGAANIASAGSVWEFDFTIDGSGNITVSAGTADQFFTSVAGGVAAVAETIADSALFNTSFSLKMTSNGDSFGIHPTGRFGVNTYSTSAEAAGERLRISRDETITFDWDLTGLPTGYTFQMDAFTTGYANSNGNYSINGVTNTNPGYVRNGSGDVELSTPVFTGGSDPAPITIGVTGDGDIGIGPVRFVITPVPEPATAGLVSISAAALLLFRRFRT